MGEARLLQDAPPALIPQESLAAAHVLDVLRPYTVRQVPMGTVERVHVAVEGAIAPSGANASSDETRVAGLQSVCRTCSHRRARG